MRTIRIYQPGNYAAGQTFELSDEAAQHIHVVLRRQLGDQFILFNGNNCEFEAQITAIHKKKLTVTLLASRKISRESPRTIHLAQAVSKGERMEWVMQKAVELGVTSITPILSAHSVVRLDAERMTKKIAQWQAIVIAACEQCGRNWVPPVLQPLSFAEYCQREKTSLRFILDPESSKTWRDYEFNEAELSLLIGPEGGFNEEEMQQANAAKFSPLSLGPRILRTETAAIAALSLLQALAGDL